jgi:hypothetical protein
MSGCNVSQKNMTFISKPAAGAALKVRFYKISSKKEMKEFLSVID